MKTISLKKVSAVAVASLGFGLLSVVPAQAAITAGSVVLSSASVTTAVGTAVNVTFTAANTGTLGDGDSIQYEPAVTRKPSDSSLALAAPASTDAASAKVALKTGGEATVAGWALSTTNTNYRTDTCATAASCSNLAAASGVRGTISVTPDKAGIYVITLTANASAGTDGTATLTVYAGYDAGGTVNTKRAYPTQGSNTTTGWAATAGGQATVRITGIAASTTYWVTTNNGSIIAATERDNASDYIDPVAFTNGTNFSGGFKFVTDSSATTSEAMDVTVTDTGSPASTTVKVVTYDASTGAATTFVEATVTWGVAAAPSAQYSLLTLNTGTGTTATGAADDTTATIASSSISGGAAERFRIQVVVRDQYNVAYTGATLAAKIDGSAGSLGISGTANSGGSVAGSSISAAMTSSSVGSISVFSNGVSGKAVITITATTPAGVATTLGTKTVTFAGSASTATVTQNLFVAKAGTQLGATPATTKVTEAGVSTTPALVAEVKDSNGNLVVAGATVKITSSDSTVIVAGTCVELSVDADPATAGNQPAAGTFECPVSGAVGAASGKSATITFSVLSSTTGLYSIVATPITFTIGGAISKSVMAVNKATYTAGEAVELTATSTDASGNKAYDGQTPFASISANKSFGGTNGALSLTSKEIVNGKYSTTSSKGVASVFAPSTPGSFTISGLATDLATGTAYSITGTVADATAAITTQIDALNAKIVALNALIAKIMKKLGVK